VLSYVRVSRQLLIALMGELELCNGYRDHCLKLLITFGIGLTCSLNQALMAQITSRTHLSDKLWWFQLVSKIWSNHKFVSWHDVWTLFGVVHFAYMCSTRSISYLSLLCAPLVVNPLLKLLKLDQTCLNAIFHLIWSPWAFASTCLCCYIYMIASTRASFQIYLL
jgi:hypothetical protein